MSDFTPPNPHFRAGPASSNPDVPNASGSLSHRLGTLRRLPTPEKGERNMAVSVLFRIDQNRHIKVVDGGPTPPTPL